jgi:hypothetical protein
MSGARKKNIASKTVAVFVISHRFLRFGVIHKNVALARKRKGQAVKPRFSPNTCDSFITILEKSETFRKWSETWVVKETLTFCLLKPFYKGLWKPSNPVGHTRGCWRRIDYSAPS